MGKFVFAGGETGGHVYMAVALIQRLQELKPDLDFLFVGTPKGLENRILPDLGVKVERLSIGGLSRTGPFKRFQTILQLPIAMLWAAKIVRGFSPSIVVGLGGYSSGPVVLAAALMRIPCLVIEPNVYPGLANRLLAPCVDRVAVAFEETAQCFGKKAILTGIPVRKQFYRGRLSVDDGAPLRILIFGGSQGSVAINRMVCEAIKKLSPDRIQLVHQTGTRDRDYVEKWYESLKMPGTILEFINEMPRQVHWADLVICRAGALTIAELTAAGKASILIPFPYAANDHQRENARAMARHGAALILEEGEESGSCLAQMVQELDTNRIRLRELSEASASLSRLHSCDQIIGVLKELICVTENN